MTPPSGTPQARAGDPPPPRTGTAHPPQETP